MLYNRYLCNMTNDDLLDLARYCNYNFDIIMNDPSLTFEQKIDIVKSAPYMTRTYIMTKEEILEKFGYEL